MEPAHPLTLAPRVALLAAGVVAQVVVYRWGWGWALGGGHRYGGRLLPLVVLALRAVGVVTCLVVSVAGLALVAVALSPRRRPPPR